jgi:hypothetical protein
MLSSRGCKETITTRDNHRDNHRKRQAVREGVSTDSLKFHPGPTLIRPLDTPRRTGLARGNHRDAREQKQRTKPEKKDAMIVAKITGQRETRTQDAATENLNFGKRIRICFLYFVKAPSQSTTCGVPSQARSGSRWPPSGHLPTVR